MSDTVASTARPHRSRTRRVTHESVGASARTSRTRRGASASTRNAGSARAVRRSRRRVRPRSAAPGSPRHVRAHPRAHARSVHHRRRVHAHGSGCARIGPLGHLTAVPSGSGAFSSRSVADRNGSGHEAGTNGALPRKTGRRRRHRHRHRADPSHRAGSRPRSRSHGLRAATSLPAKKGSSNQPAGPRLRTDTSCAPGSIRSSRYCRVGWMSTTRIVPAGFTTRCSSPMAVRRSSRSLMFWTTTLAATTSNASSAISAARRSP